MKASESNTQPSVKDESYWKKIIADQESSHLTRKAYCHKHQVNYDNFGYWWRKLKTKSVKSLIPITIKSESNQYPEKSKTLSTMQFKNGTCLHIYDKEVLQIILSKLI